MEVVFYSNEGNEPPHVHCRKGDSECKYWLDADTFDAIEAYAYAMAPADRRTVRKIIFENFDYILKKWNRFQEDADV